MPATACIGATWRFAIFRKAKASSTSWSKREGRRAAGGFCARRLRGRRADQGVRRARAAQGGAGDRESAFERDWVSGADVQIAAVDGVGYPGPKYEGRML